MPIKVVDSSALAAILFGEPEGERLGERLQGQTIVAPSLLAFEMASVCLKKLRRYPKQRDALLESFKIFQQMEILEAEIDLNALIPLAEETKLTVYDASYLYLARELKAELITLDRNLQRLASS